MEIIRRETDYALRCLLRLARLDSDELASVKVMADAENIPYELLRKVFQRLTKAGLVDSVRGKQGGFRLAQSVHDITLLHILEAVQGPVAMNRCLSGQHKCPNSEICTFHPALCKMQDAMNSLLSDSTLGDYLSSK